jgi:hypothetical protein
MEIVMTKINGKARSEFGDEQFAFPAQRKEPLENAAHVRNAVSRFNQVRGVTDPEKDAAWRRILDAAKKYDVNVDEATWRDLLKGR